MDKQLREYLLDNYGVCLKGESCTCIQPVTRTSPIKFQPWWGRACPNWKPDISIVEKYCK